MSEAPFKIFLGHACNCVLCFYIFRSSLPINDLNQQGEEVFKYKKSFPEQERTLFAVRVIRASKKRRGLKWA